MNRTKNGSKLLRMNAPMIRKYAELIAGYSIAAREGERILVEGNVAAEPLMKEIMISLLKRGCHPFLKPFFDDSLKVFLSNASQDQIGYLHGTELFEAGYWDASIRVRAPRIVKALSGVAPGLISCYNRKFRPVSDIMQRREAKKGWRWSLLLFPTAGLAGEAGMSQAEFEDYVIRTCKLDAADPAAEWKKLSAEQAGLIRRLEGIKGIRIESPDTDLSFAVKGRRWVNSDGKRNMPSGEVFTSPVENSVSGHIRFSFPGIHMGQEIRDIRLEFRKGRVISAKAARGEGLLKALLKADSGASRVGEFAFGTNRGANRFVKNMLFDEKMAGTIHLALGNSFSEAGGRNRSSIHWDLLKSMAGKSRIFADRRLIYENAELLID